MANAASAAEYPPAVAYPASALSSPPVLPVPAIPALAALFALLLVMSLVIALQWSAENGPPSALPCTAVLSLGRVVRFGLAGGASLIVDVVLQRLFRAGLGIPVWLAPALSYEMGLLAHFFALSWWVFRQPVTLRRLVQFHITAATAAAITLGITYALLAQPAIPSFADATGPFGTYGPEVAKLLGTGTATGWTFFSSFFWIWKPAPPGHAGRPGAAGT